MTYPLGQANIYDGQYDMPLLWETFHSHTANSSPGPGVT